MIKWKREGSADPSHYAKDLAELIVTWNPVIPADWLVTCPPQGASHPGEYAAAKIASQVAERLAIRFAACLSRTDTKLWHGPHHALKQSDFLALIPLSYPVVLIVDDFITSCTTMRLALEAVNRENIPAFGFAWSGH